MFANMPSMWAGTEQALKLFLEQKASVEADPSIVTQARTAASASLPAESDRSRLLRVIGDVGVISIHGSLVNGGASWLNEFFGLCSYGEISDALVEAAQAPEVKSILLDINSGGGDVAGVEEVATLIKRVDTEIKPVVAHTLGYMCSAAYWLGSSARSIFATATAEVGSISAMIVHQEVSKALEEDGVVVTVFSSGKYKTLGNRYEPLSELAREVIQDRVDTLGRMFTAQVAANRGVGFEVAHGTFGEGRVFTGEEASRIGLIDGVMTFQSVVEKMQGFLDTTEKVCKDVHNVFKGATSMNKVLATTPNTQETSAAADTEAAAPATPETQTAVVTQADTGVAAPSAVQVLTDQLVQARVSQKVAEAQVTTLSKELDDVKAQIAVLTPMVKTSVSRMQVALGMSAEVADMDVTTLVATHENLLTQFESKFRANGIAAVAPADAGSQEKAAEAAAQAALRAARIQATRLK